MHTFRVQILLSTYNGEQYIEEQISSLIRQEGVSVQILIRDDGSTDNTLEKLEHLKKLYPQQIVIFKGENRGVVQSFFDLILMSSNEFDVYAFCDQDDVWNKDKLITAVSSLNKFANNVPLMYCSATQMVDQWLTPMKKWPVALRRPLSHYNALIENVCVGCTMVFNKTTMELVKNNIPLNVKNVIMHDWWIYLCVSSFGRVVFDPQPSILYRQHHNNVLGGATNGWKSKWSKRWNRFINGKNHYILSRQAIEFAQTFQQKLDDQKQQEISRFISFQSKNIIKRAIYIFRAPFYRQSVIDNLIYKFVFIIGRL
ncbi:glycosyltransferase family 2 protein [Paenibacillus polymyxa]|uniref:glycosyltransferase family 2 protein n=1 Tax=Paenibacillus polymyxa TaxID=1406 RepID=UPI0025B6657C|nr:glycosyltransferase family 2 protein [Paenibacillus polymyxa]MDN4088832.1 glycosyltransferase family 2 protein [Paenibacillus polymyxa]MDN4109209.1 glycosyltransferase family 2 protein [Paenibacillus polymyxa]